MRKFIIIFSSLILANCSLNKDSQYWTENSIENNYQYDIDKLIVKEAYCGKQVIMKRFRARAKGRAAPILKPYSNVTIILSETKKMESHGSKS